MSVQWNPYISYPPLSCLNLAKVGGHTFRFMATGVKGDWVFLRKVSWRFFKEQSSTSMLGKIVQNWGSFVGPSPSISGLSFEHRLAMRKDMSSMYRY